MLSSALEVTGWVGLVVSVLFAAGVWAALAVVFLSILAVGYMIGEP